ncbi:hypothetical protein P8C59_007126 [Phyllachora maydis]|uniref:Uncharacterized protein n=1 Tax=Phyllachora maydis TaxID=1825666 RepID=A0AAD9I834_9PEZI|nr:hypothetical protein P8C59_007126 [Phyllachora maydis]
MLRERGIQSSSDLNALARRKQYYTDVEDQAIERFHPLFSFLVFFLRGDGSELAKMIQEAATPETTKPHRRILWSDRGHRMQVKNAD